MNGSKNQFAVWEEALSGHLEDGQIDPNSISGVLYDLFWEMAAYESYVAICKDNTKSVLASPIFGQLTAFNYLQVQALRIRRLTEISETKQGDKDRSVYSLMNILNEMKRLRKAGALTADYICEAYEIPPFRESWNQGGIKFVGAENDVPTIASTIAANNYSMLERICDKEGLLKKGVLDALEGRLLGDKSIELNSVISFVGKHIAHSASIASRKQAGIELGLRVDDMKKAIQGITEAYYACLMLITRSDNASLIPVGWEDRLSNLSKGEVEIVHDTFKRVESECENWKENGYALIHVGEDCTNRTKLKA
jgi:hypothetical protein